jgi:diguanylate cyclase
LVRWIHPEQGVVSPSEFISVAEESGQILTLGAWVLDEACRQAKVWSIQGDFRIAVNVSALQFAHPNFLITVMNALKESGLPGYSLELELTESIVMGRPEDVKRTLLDLKDLGIRLAIDDFGTGYSSLAYLRDLPIDTVKIDKSFIQDLDANAEDEPFSHALVETITGLAKRLKLEVVAEGVETEAQCVLLRKLGCQVGQGYYFAKPIPAENVEPLLSNMLHRPTLMALTAIRNPELVSRN